MKICSKTLEKLRDIINGDKTAGYRKGSELVDFLMNWDLRMFMGKDSHLVVRIQLIDCKGLMVHQH